MTIPICVWQDACTWGLRKSSVCAQVGNAFTIKKWAQSSIQKLFKVKLHLHGKQHSIYQSEPCLHGGKWSFPGANTSVPPQKGPASGLSLELQHESWDIKGNSVGIKNKWMSEWTEETASRSCLQKVRISLNFKKVTKKEKIGRNLRYSQAASVNWSNTEALGSHFGWPSW